MLTSEEYEGYRYSIFGEPGKFYISVQDCNGEEVLDKEQSEETYSCEFLAQMDAELAIRDRVEENLRVGCHFYPYEQAVEDFKEQDEPLVIARYGRDDEIALREAFNNWTDMLCKDGIIDDSQYNGWDNPY